MTFRRRARLDNFGPVGHVSVAHPVVRTVGHGVAGTQYLLLGQVGKAIAPRVRPAEEVELDPARTIVDHVRRLIESLARRFGRIPVQFRYILAAGGVGSPAGWFVPAHLFRYALIGEGGGACLGPERVAISMIAVMMRIEDVLYRFRGNRLDVRHERPCAARVVRVHDNQIIGHLDDDVIAMAELIQIALAKPHAWNDLLNGFQLGVGAGRHERRQGEYRKGTAGKQSMQAKPDWEDFAQRFNSPFLY